MFVKIAIMIVVDDDDVVELRTEALSDDVDE
jgi:hypothetical protein